LCQQRDLVLSEQSQFSQMGVDASVPLDDESINAAVVSSMRSVLRKVLTTQMLKVVDYINQFYAPDFEHGKHSKHHHHHNPVDFPSLAGSHLVLTSPALEFVKATTHIMSLDESLAEEVFFSLYICNIWVYFFFLGVRTGVFAQAFASNAAAG
jgi:hypothetical protein